MAERLVQQVAAEGKPPVTVSIGVAEAHAQLEGADAVIGRADAALYRAKAAGRNRAVAAIGMGAIGNVPPAQGA